MNSFIQLLEVEVAGFKKLEKYFSRLEKAVRISEQYVQ